MKTLVKFINFVMEDVPEMKVTEREVRVAIIKSLIALKWISLGILVLAIIKDYLSW